MNYKNFVKSIRQKHQLSVKDLADFLGVSPRTVEHWEGNNEPSGPALIVLKNFDKLFKRKK